jgi:hypothetical protein
MSQEKVLDLAICVVVEGPVATCARCVSSEKEKSRCELTYLQSTAKFERRDSEELPFCQKE